MRPLGIADGATRVEADIVVETRWYVFLRVAGVGQHMADAPFLLARTPWQSRGSLVDLEGLDERMYVPLCES